MTKLLLEWKRARRDETSLSDRRIWESRCKGYHVIEAVGKFSGMGTVFYAIELPCTLISRHRKKGPAELSCERHNRKKIKNGKI